MCAILQNMLKYSQISSSIAFTERIQIISKKGEFMDDIIILVDENGDEQEYELLDTIEYEGERYVVLIQEDDDEVSILKVESEEDDDLSLVSCDDAVIEEVYELFKENNTENYDFDD